MNEIQIPRWFEYQLTQKISRQAAGGVVFIRKSLVAGKVLVTDGSYYVATLEASELKGKAVRVRPVNNNEQKRIEENFWWEMQR